MTRTLPNILSRRVALLCLVLTPLAPMAAHAIDLDESNPVDELMRNISVEQFEKLDKNELHMYKLAVTQGRSIKIGDYSITDSKRLILNRAAGAGN